MSSLLQIVAAAVLLTVAAPRAGAASVLYASGPRTVGGVSVNVSAQFDFDPSNHNITLSLLNLQNNPTSLEQLIAGVRFTVAGAGSSLSPVISSSSIGTFDVDMYGIPEADTQPNTWSVSATGTQVAFCTICAHSSGHELLIGAPNVIFYAATFENTQNPYIIASGGAYQYTVLHNLDTSPSWVFHLPSITSSVSVTSVTFDFGMTYDDATLQLAPEPGPVVTMMAGLMLILMRLRKYRQRAARTAASVFHSATD